MTNHWRDIRHADLIMINGANPAEAHPVGFQWMMRAKLDRGAKMIHVDPRFTRTSAVADQHLRIRTGTDVAYFGGLINYVLQNNLYHDAYVQYATNAGLVVKEAYAFNDGLFNAYDATKRTYDASQWAYEIGPDGFAVMDINHPRSVLNLMRQHYSRYTPEMVERITGIPRDQFLSVAKLVGEMGKPDKVMTIVYAVGLTHHTTGVQLIRSGALLQLLLGNIGRPGGGMNAERGHANIQGNTDHAISWDILPGYLRTPAPGQKTVDDYVAQSASKQLRPNSLNFFGINYRKFMVSLLKTWYGDAATKDNEFAFDYLPKPASNASWLSIFDQALRGKMEGVMLSGMTATSIGPDSNQVLQALSQPQVAVRHGRLPDHQLGVLDRARHGPEQDPDRGVPAPGHALDREGRLVHQQRPVGPVEGAGAAARGQRHARPLDHGRAVRPGEGAVPVAGRRVQGPDHGADVAVQGSPQAGPGRDRPGDQRQGPHHRAAADHVRQSEGRRHDHGR